MITSSEGNDGEKELVTPPRKKLKQAQLSFQKLSPSVDNTSPKTVKKRKISEDSGDDIQVVKVIKTNDEQSRTEGENQALVVDEEVKGKKSNDKQHASLDHSNVSCDITLDKENSSTDCESLGNNAIDTKDSESEPRFEEPKLPATETQPTDRKENNSVKEQKVTDNDSDSTGSDSIDISDDELNETVEDNNGSGSDIDSAKGDDVGPSSSMEDVENEAKSLPQTPNNRSSSTEITRKKKLTPKQILQREAAAKKREEKEKLRKEKQQQRAEEKERKRKENEEKRKLKKKEMKEKEEQKRKEREEKEEQKRKEKEEKEKKRLAELEQKSEERRKKEEQRVLEKRKKDEKRLAEEEAKRKEEEVKKKEAALFANFFVTPKGGSKTTDEVKVKVAEHFMPFEIKADMRLAPVLRTKFDETRMETFDTMLGKQSTSVLYLKQLKQHSYVAGKSGKTWPLSDLRETKDEDDDVIPVTSDNEVVESHPVITHHKAKLLLFCENRRPPYWGTWRKKSKKIKPICPFNKDEGFFDYEVDSDDEWEEEEPGESLHGSDDEKESEDEYEVDNELFVPHGYLSDEENNEEEETVNPETMKAKLKFLEMEFEEEMKHKTERIKPRHFGCFWANQISNPVGDRVLELLSSYRAVFQEMPIVLSGPSTPEVSSPVSESQGTCPSTGSKKKKFPESFVPPLIKLVHGNINGHGFLVKEFSSYMRNQLETAREESEKDNENNLPASSIIVSKMKISEKIKQIATRMPCPEEGPFLNRSCWYVSSEIRSAYGLEDLTIPNKVWNYINTPKREIELSNTIPSPVVSDVNVKSKSLPLITKFTKKMSQEERQKQLALAGSSGDGDIEIIDAKAASTVEGKGKTSIGVQSMKTNSSVNNSKSTLNSEVTPLKSGSVSSSNEDNKKCSGNSDIRKKLLQFKSKGSSIIHHLEPRKRIPILKSAPLGQEISPSTKKETKVSQEKECQSEVPKSNNVKESSVKDDCIMLD